MYFGGAFGATDHVPMRIAFTRLPAPEVEEIDPSRERRLRPKITERQEGRHAPILKLCGIRACNLAA